MPSSIRSLLAKWVGGAGAPPFVGIRSLLARWLGGAVAETLPTDLQGGGSADVERTRSYEGSGGGVFGNSATVAQIRGQEDLSVVVSFPTPIQPKAAPLEEPPPKRRVRQTYSYGPAGGFELSGTGIVSRSRAILASGGLSLGFPSTVTRAKSVHANSRFAIGGSAQIETYNAIYDTEDEEILMLMAAAT